MSSVARLADRPAGPTLMDVQHHHPASDPLQCEHLNTSHILRVASTTQSYIASVSEYRHFRMAKHLGRSAARRVTSGSTERVLPSISDAQALLWHDVVKVYVLNHVKLLAALLRHDMQLWRDMSGSHTCLRHTSVMALVTSSSTYYKTKLTQISKLTQIFRRSVMELYQDSSLGTSKQHV